MYRRKTRRGGVTRKCDESDPATMSSALQSDAPSESGVEVRSLRRRGRAEVTLCSNVQVLLKRVDTGSSKSTVSYKGVNSMKREKRKAAHRSKATNVTDPEQQSRNCGSAPNSTRQNSKEFNRIYSLRKRPNAEANVKIDATKHGRKVTPLEPSMLTPTISKKSLSDRAISQSKLSVGKNGASSSDTNNDPLLARCENTEKGVNIRKSKRTSNRCSSSAVSPASVSSIAEERGQDLSRSSDKNPRNHLPIKSKQKSSAGSVANKKAMATSSFYSKKQGETSSLRSWLRTANTRGETPKPTNTDEDDNEFVKSLSLKSPESENNLSLKSLSSASAKDRASQGAPSRLKILNMKTPVGTATRYAFKKADSSTPQVTKPQSDETEYLFGFENLLEPAATLLDEVSPIPRPKLPKAILDKKKKNKDTKPWDMPCISPLAEANTKRLRKKKDKKTDLKSLSPDELTDQAAVDLFHVIPIETEPLKKPADVFSYEKEPESPPRQKKNKPVISLTGFDIETALPWQEIMDHELVIESV